MAATLEQVEAQVKSLTAEEQRQLRERMDSWQTPTLEATTPEQERRFAQHLLAIGMLDHMPEGHPEDYVSPPPIVVHGEPVSETVIRERR